MFGTDGAQRKREATAKIAVSNIPQVLQRSLQATVVARHHTAEQQQRQWFRPLRDFKQRNHAYNS